MTDKEAIFNDGRKVTFAYERKVNLGNYENEGVSLYMTDFVPEGEDIATWTAGQAEPAFNIIKSLVWDALGLEMRFDDTGKPELVDYTPPTPQAPQAPVVTMPTNPPQQAPQQTFTPPPIQQNQRGGDNPAVAQPGYYADPPAFCKDCGNQGAEAFYDNRADVDAKIQAGAKIGPDFKCKNCGGGNGKGKPIFRPGSYDYNQGVGTVPALSQTPPQMPQAPPFDPAVEGEAF